MQTIFKLEKHFMAFLVAIFFDYTCDRDEDRAIGNTMVYTEAYDRAQSSNSPKIAKIHHSGTVARFRTQPGGWGICKIIIYCAEKLQQQGKS